MAFSHEEEEEESVIGHISLLYNESKEVRVLAPLFFLWRRIGVG
jgi:hypothetical protein